MLLMNSIYELEQIKKGEDDSTKLRGKAIKEMIEKEGDKALLNNMKRDVIPGVEKFREEYVKWLNSE